MMSLSPPLRVPPRRRLLRGGDGGEAEEVEDEEMEDLIVEMAVEIPPERTRWGARRTWCRRLPALDEASFLSAVVGRRKEVEALGAARVQIRILPLPQALGGPEKQGDEAAVVVLPQVQHQLRGDRGVASGGPSAAPLAEPEARAPVDLQLPA